MKVVTAVVNNPIFIEIQYHTLKKYFKGDYEFIVFNDAKDFPDFTNDGDVTIRQKIESLCNSLNIRCVNIPNEQHKTTQCAAVRAADSMNYILNYQKQNPDKYLLIDSDMFLIDHFDVSKYDPYSCAIVLQSRGPNSSLHYFWNGIYYFDFEKLTNTELLNWNCCDKCDVGGMMQKWLKTQIAEADIPNTDDLRWTPKTFFTDKIYFIKHLWSCTWNLSELPENLKNRQELINFFKEDPRNVNDKFFCEIYDNVFLHYRAGGNWMKEGLTLHNQLSEKLKAVLLTNL